MTVKLEVGKFYRDRDGIEWKVLGLHPYGHDVYGQRFVTCCPQVTPGWADVDWHYPDGRYFEDREHEWDLIKEVEPKKKLKGYLVVTDYGDVLYYRNKEDTSFQIRPKTAIIDLSAYDIEYREGDRLEDET